MKVPHGEGVAIYTGPESCVYICKVVGSIVMAQTAKAPVDEPATGSTSGESSR